MPRISPRVGGSRAAFSLGDQATHASAGRTAAESLLSCRPPAPSGLFELPVEVRRLHGVGPVGVCVVPAPVAAVPVRYSGSSSSTWGPRPCARGSSRAWRSQRLGCDTPLDAFPAIVRVSGILGVDGPVCAELHRGLRAGEGFGGKLVHHYG